MIKADLHVHSRCSEHPSDWFLKRIGAAESYTDPETLYRNAKEQGMDLVTITDHNRIQGALELQSAHPKDVITGVESTAYFPEDGCKVHVLVYGLTEDDYCAIERIRTDIYVLRDFLKERGLAHSLAHASYPVNDKLTSDHLEKLVLLFDVFESINGGRNRLNNQIWTNVLKRLTPETIERLQKKHNIAPSSDMPWVKGFTGGSDDHGGIFIGKTFTVAKAADQQELLDAIRARETVAGGMNSNFQNLAFTIYKVFYDFSKNRSNGFSKSFISQLTETIFERNTLSLKDNLVLNKLKLDRRWSSDRIKELIIELLDEFKVNGNVLVEKKLDIVYDKLSAILDALMSKAVSGVEKDLAKGDLVGVIGKISSFIPAFFLSAPFLGASASLIQKP